MHRITGAAFILLALTGCGPRAHIPPRPQPLPGSIPSTDSIARLAGRLAPVLYLQPDESFRLTRVVAVVHPTRRIIAYHLLWRDDVHGAWVPFTIPTDQEIVWVEYDEAHSPAALFTFWHKDILHADWRGKGTPAVDVQWGKHGSLPRGVKADDLRWPRTLGVFWVAAVLGVPDFALGRLSRKGPLCFCHGYARYRRFTQPLELAPRLDAVVRTENPHATLRAVFGRNYSRKPHWPEEPHWPEGVKSSRRDP